MIFDYIITGIGFRNFQSFESSKIQNSNIKKCAVRTFFKIVKFQIPNAQNDGTRMFKTFQDLRVPDFHKILFEKSWYFCCIF